MTVPTVPLVGLKARLAREKGKSKDLQGGCGHYQYWPVHG